MKSSKLEELLAFHLFAIGIKNFEREFKFCETRRWRSDFAFVNEKLLVECEGGIWINGAHSRGKHFISDCEKYNNATLLGYRLLRFTEREIKSGEAAKFIYQVLHETNN
jgi:very-short-patch-repair endonuclease